MIHQVAVAIVKRGINVQRSKFLGNHTVLLPTTIMMMSNYIPSLNIPSHRLTTEAILPYKLNVATFFLQSACTIGQRKELID